MLRGTLTLGSHPVLYIPVLQYFVSYHKNVSTTSNTTVVIKYRSDGAENFVKIRRKILSPKILAYKNPILQQKLQQKFQDPTKSMTVQFSCCHDNNIFIATR